MKRPLVTAAVALAIALPVLAQDNPFSGFKGKIREGNWEYKMQMQMEGMPQGGNMAMPPITRCITPGDVDKGGFASKDGKMPDGCTVKNMKMAGAGASWTMECTKNPKMTVDSDITFGKDEFTMKQKMVMDREGQMMKMNQTKNA